MKRRIFITMTSLAALNTSGCIGLGQNIASTIAPKVNIQSVNLRTLDPTKATLDVGLQVFNPNPTPIPLQGIDYALVINGTNVASGQQKQNLEIGANSSRNVIIPVDLNVAQLSNVMPSIMASRQAQYSVTGNAHFPLIKLPFSKQGSLGI